MATFELATCNGDNVLDVRDIIERVEELRGEREDYEPEENADSWGMAYPEELAELETLEAFLDEMKGYGGDEQWEGDWYPVTLILEPYFETYAQELAEECGMVAEGATWPNNHIDWEAAARELAYDYSSATCGEFTYMYR